MKAQEKSTQTRILASSARLSAMRVACLVVSGVPIKHVAFLNRASMSTQHAQRKVRSINDAQIDAEKEWSSLHFVDIFNWT